MFLTVRTVFDFWGGRPLVRLWIVFVPVTMTLRVLLNEQPYRTILLQQTNVIRPI